MHVREMLHDRGFQVAQANRLEAYIRIVKILNRRLDKDDAHKIPLPEEGKRYGVSSIIYPTTSDVKYPNRDVHVRAGS
jgi:hypothetical protein